VCEFVYRSLQLKGEPPMTRFLAAQLSTSHWFDISAARGELGYQPRVSTNEGMQRLGEWLQRTRSNDSHAKTAVGTISP
jgi:nucleoside-diphosphate-sugar epimerase